METLMNPNNPNPAPSGTPTPPAAPVQGVSIEQFNQLQETVRQMASFVEDASFIISGIYKDPELRAKVGEKFGQPGGNPPADPNPNPAPQFLFIIVLMHALHVLTGLLFLTVAFIRSIIALRNLKSDEVLEKIELSEKGVLSIRTDLLSLYWHFMGILWLYLFGFLYFNL